MEVPYRGAVFKLGKDGGTVDMVSHLQGSIMETTVKETELALGSSGDVLGMGRPGYVGADDDTQVFD